MSSYCEEAGYPHAGTLRTCEDLRLLIDSNPDSPPSENSALVGANFPAKHHGLHILSGLLIITGHSVFNWASTCIK